MLLSTYHRAVESTHEQITFDKKWSRLCLQKKFIYTNVRDELFATAIIQAGYKYVVSRKLFFFLIRAIQGKPPGLNALVGNKYLKPSWLYMLTAMVCLWIK